MKQKIKLTERDLTKIIKESCYQILNEIGDTANGRYMLGRHDAVAKDRGYTNYGNFDYGKINANKHRNNQMSPRDFYNSSRGQNSDMDYKHGMEKQLNGRDSTEIDAEKSRNEAQNQIRKITWNCPNCGRQNPCSEEECRHCGHFGPLYYFNNLNKQGAYPNMYS